MVHAVCGSDVIHSQGEKVANGDSAAPKPEELRMAVAHKVRKGGIVFQLEPGAKVVLPESAAPDLPDRRGRGGERAARHAGALAGR